MKKVILTSLVISLFVLMSCNNLFESDKTKDSSVKSEQEDVKPDNKKELTPLEQGRNFAMQTQKVLGKNLMNAIKTKGTAYALTFCKAEAFPLTDSMAIALNVKLKRVSDKPRDADNQASIHEVAYIEKAKELLANAKEIKPEMTEIDGKMVGYYPIMTNQLCMQCHGAQNTEVLSATLLHIKELYPEDKAVDYKINELRGIWVVEMIKDIEENTAK